jgi:hypothetical protein
MSEADAMDIYYHGEEQESGKKVRKTIGMKEGRK